PHLHVLPVRPVARRRVDVRAVGRPQRRAARRRAHLPRPRVGLHARPVGARPRGAGLGHVRDLRRRGGDVPRAQHPPGRRHDGDDARPARAPGVVDRAGARCALRAGGGRVRAGRADRHGQRARLGMARSRVDRVAHRGGGGGAVRRGVLAGAQSGVHLLPVLMARRWLAAWLLALVAVLGASRIQFAVDRERVEQATGRTTAMLAVNGAYPVAALRWLAKDTSFKGLAVIGVDSRGLDRRHWEMQQRWIDHYEHRWTYAREIHRLLLTPLQEYLVMMRSPFAWVALARRELAGEPMPFNDYL